MPSVLTASNFEADKISFGKQKPNTTNGGYNIEINIGDSSNEIVIQTPKMRAPFGISTDKTNPFKKSLDISFQGMDSNKSIKEFKELVEKVDSIAIDYALNNSETFFKKKLSRVVIAEYYYSGIKKSKKEQYSDTFKFKLPFLKPNPEKNLPNGKFITTFWNTNGQEQNDAYLDNGDYVTALLKPKMLWVASRSFGITWECSQLMINKNNRVSGFAFKKTSESDEEVVEESDEEEVIEVSEEEVEVDA
jgi:hypothetical protein